MKIAVISPEVPANVKELINVNEYVVIACDKAVEALINQKIAIDLAIGDFDSLENKELLKDIKTIKLDNIKDFSDTSYAIKYAYKKTSDVILIGGIKGTRSDHLIANLFLMEKYPNLVIMDDTNKFTRLNEGSYTIKKLDYKYLSIFPITNSRLTVKGTKYTLNKKELLAFDPLGLSNEINDSEAVIELHEGVLLIVQSK